MKVEKHMSSFDWLSTNYGRSECHDDKTKTLLTWFHRSFITPKVARKRIKAVIALVWDWKGMGSGEGHRRHQKFFCAISIFLHILNVLGALLLFFFQCPYLVSSLREALRSPKNRQMISEAPPEKEGEGFICPGFCPSLPLWQQTFQCSGKQREPMSNPPLVCCLILVLGPCPFALNLHPDGGFQATDLSFLAFSEASCCQHTLSSL